MASRCPDPRSRKATLADAALGAIGLAVLAVIVIGSRSDPTAFGIPPERTARPTPTPEIVYVYITPRPVWTPITPSPTPSATPVCRAEPTSLTIDPTVRRCLIDIRVAGESEDRRYLMADGSLVDLYVRPPHEGPRPLGFGDPFIASVGAGNTRLASDDALGPRFTVAVVGTSDRWVGVRFETGPTAGAWELIRGVRSGAAAAP